MDRSSCILGPEALGKAMRGKARPAGFAKMKNTVSGPMRSRVEETRRCRAGALGRIESLASAPMTEGTGISKKNIGIPLDRVPNVYYYNCK